MYRENYVGQVFGTRRIIRNDCVDNDWLLIGKPVPNDKSKYRLSECLCCGRIIPVLIPKISDNPPKRCCFCSGISNYSNIKETNTWACYDEYAVLNVLFKGKVVSGYIDIEDYDMVSAKTWRVSQKKNKYYLISGSKNNQVYLHQLLVKENIPDGFEIDHRDGNSLNNRKYNLRIVTRLQNIQNVGARIDNQIGIRGISRDGKKFIVDFSFNKQRHYFKHWNTIQEAVYCRKFAEEYFGLDMLNRNPLARQYLTLDQDHSLKIKLYVLSILQNK